MKPFLILQHRPIDEAADNEFDAFLRYGGLKPEEVRRIRMEQSGIPDVNLSDYSALICGGGPSNVSDPEKEKSKSQLHFEGQLVRLYDEILDKDFPFLGACYGIGSLTQYAGGKVSKKQFSEDVGSTKITLTDNAALDELTQGLPATFKAFVGHKEACQELAPGATLLACSENCPIQMIRFKTNIYATQFHPELDTEGISLRIRIYRNHGYFAPEQAESMIDQIRHETVTVPEIILKRFVDRYRQ